MIKKGFTLFEVMIALVVFSVGVLSFTYFQAKAAGTTFETQSATIAKQIAIETAESLQEVSIATLSNAGMDIYTLSWSGDTAFPGLVATGPCFSVSGVSEACGSSSYFTRRMKMYQVNDPGGTPALVYIEIAIIWPKTGFTLPSNAALYDLNANANPTAVHVFKTMLVK